MSARFTMQLRSTLSIRLLFTALLGVNFSVIASEVNPSMEDTATSVTTMEKQLFKVPKESLSSIQIRYRTLYEPKRI